MTKNRNAHKSGMKKNITNDISDNKDNRPDIDSNNNDNSGTDANKTQESDGKAYFKKPDGEPKTVTDKDARQSMSAEEKLAEMQDRYLRLSAEFDNYRKRTLREKIELTKYAGENILLNIIPVMDDFERALKLMENASDCAALKSGIDHIYTKFSEFIKQNGIKEIVSLNENFNVDLHEAITKVPVEDVSMKGKVVDVIVKGYWLNDKVMRFSKVVVGE